MNNTFISLSQLNNLIAGAFKELFLESFWVMAETSDVRENSSGHCYLELIEKDPKTNVIIAKSRSYIWSNTYRAIKQVFEKQTGRKFTSGLKILVRAFVEFHPIYGFGLNICDIDPNYTLGDLQAQRQKILKQLEDDGIINLNRDLEIPILPQRIAVISSSTAAGYEDFLRHLNENSEGFVFYTRLFPALMQGDKTAASIISALDNIFTYNELFDVVVIIRGGGASSDLSAFDNYELAANCAQFPLPVITGIGHERDDTVLDFVSAYRAKTPTAVADFLIDKMQETAELLFDCQTDITHGASNILKTANTKLYGMISRLPLAANYLIEKRKTQTDNFPKSLISAITRYFDNKNLTIKEKEAFFRLSSPEYVLAKGYSITTKNGKAIRSAAELELGEMIETRFSYGIAKSRVESK